MKIGDKVVCVDDSPCVVCGGKTNHVLGSVYVVNGFFVYKSIPRLGLIGYRTNCKHAPAGFENFTRASRYRLLDDLKAEAAKKQSSHPARPSQPATTTAPDLGTDWRASI